MRLRYGILLALIIALAAVYFSPFLVGSGFRLWTRWQARAQGIQIELEKVDAPFLRPITIGKIRITDPAHGSFEIDAERVTVNFSFVRVLAGSSGRRLKALSIDQLKVRLTGGPSALAQNSRLNWALVQKMLPGAFEIEHFDLRLEGEDTVILLHSASISGSELEARRFTADKLMVSSPLFHQTFTNLRGATKWQGDRLTLGGIILGRGLDLQSAIIDLDHLGNRRADFQFDLDTFGGKIRASFSDEWRAGHSLWDFAGSAVDISLAQTSEALGFTDRLGGSLHACKFTFRGDPRDLTHATASIWTELTDLSWHDQKADTIMLGAVFYSRQVQLQQLYVKQHDNQLTLSGQGSFGSKPSEWLSPDFRGTVSGTINDLGQFASLFGARPGDFAGQIEIEGTMDARDRKIGGHLTASGNGLSIFKMHFDQFIASFGLRASELQVEQFDLSRRHDWLHAEGRIDLGDADNYSGSVSADISNLDEYLSIFGLTRTVDHHSAPAHFQFVIDSGVWNGNVTITTPSSRPVSIGVLSLPLSIGENWDEFTVRPLNVIVSFPLLSLDNSPRWLGFNLFRGGILSGGLHLSGNLHSPKIDADMQLINGKVEAERFGISTVAGHLSLSGSRGPIDFLRIEGNGVELSFTGEVESSLDNFAINLISNAPLVNLTPRFTDCAGRITISPTPTLLAPTVSQVEFRGRLFDQNWTLTLRPTSTNAGQDMADQTIPFCAGTVLEDKPVTLGLYSPPATKAATPRRRSRRR